MEYIMKLKLDKAYYCSILIKHTPKTSLANRFDPGNLTILVF